MEGREGDGKGGEGAGGKWEGKGGEGGEPPLLWRSLRHCVWWRRKL